ncbi:hypothetical protein [Micromonospora sp. RV43]|uniref:hypothetical protein n=1 Tax=Micromonospora sp. RV43 TaxID=1661387 RepID=UPI000AEED9C6|nr:hypothetical protein [Micromonospora sp. RV43]
MTKPSIIVRELSIMSEAMWPFRDGKPVWRHRPLGSVGKFDPFPAYPHQREVVDAAVKHVQSCFAPLWDVELFIADREEEGRSNGYSSVCQDGHYEDDEWVKDPPVGLIMLSGKRVPPHPAVTRHLVAHEYGHHVEWMLNDARGEQNLYSDALVAEYAKMRGLPESTMHDGEGGTWHDSVHEIFACDFRIMVCDVETAYWPHPGVPHPHEVEGLPGWWHDALSAARRATGGQQ